MENKCNHRYRTDTVTIGADTTINHVCEMCGYSPEAGADEHKTNDLRDLGRALSCETGWMDEDIDLCHWAATEIEQLRTDNERLQWAMSYLTDHPQRSTQLLAERERLREALLWVNGQLPINSALKPHIAQSLEMKGNE